MENYWKCGGVLAKYDRPCPQKYLFFRLDKIKELGLTVDQVKSLLEVKCPRCGSFAGGHYDEVDAKV